MRISVRARAVGVAVVAAGLVAVPLAAPSSAAPKASVSCKKLTSKLVNKKATSTISNCTPAALKAGGTSTLSSTPPTGSSKGSFGMTVKWAGGKGTTVLAVKFAVQKKPGTCPKGTTKIVGTGSVKSATGAAKAITKVGEPFSGTVCTYVAKGPKQGQSSLYPGTTEKL